MKVLRTKYLPTDPGDADSPSPSRLLVIDDDPKILKLVSDVLHRYGLLIKTASSGVQGLHAARESKPDLILLDLAMPPPDGFEVLAMLKASASTHDIPVLLLSGNNDVDSKVKGFELGATDYITKPFHDRELHARVSRRVKQARLRNQMASRLLSYHERFGALADPALVAPPKESPGSKQQLDELHRIRNVLCAELSAPPSLSRLAAMIGITQPQLSRRFRDTFGTTVFGFLRETRAQRARELLVQTHLPVKTVALEVGYRNTADLTRNLKSYFGMTASELRDQHHERTSPNPS